MQCCPSTLEINDIRHPIVVLSWQQFLSLKLFRAVFGVNGLSTSLRQRGQNPETFKAFLAQILLYLKNGNFYQQLNFKQILTIYQKTGFLKRVNVTIRNFPWVIVKKSSPKNLSANCRSTVSRQLTNRLLTVYRQVKKKEKLC